MHLFHKFDNFVMNPTYNMQLQELKLVGCIWLIYQQEFLFDIT